jgi:hypothetical protein
MTLLVMAKKLIIIIVILVIIFMQGIYSYMGTQWLRKVAGSIPDDVTGFFH